MKNSKNRYKHSKFTPNSTHNITPTISVILPIYSEQKILYKVTKDLKHYLNGNMREIIAIVSPKSSKKTFLICENLKDKLSNFNYYVQKKNPGLGNAVRQGIKLAKSEYILLIDSDDEMDASSTKQMLKLIQKDRYDLIVASRWMKPNSMVGYNGTKYFLNYAFQKIVKLLFWTKISDHTLGYKLLRRDFIKNINWESEFHDIATETTLKPIVHGAKYTQVPTRWVARTEGVSKNSMMNNLKYAKFAMKLFFYKIRGAR